MLTIGIVVIGAVSLLGLHMALRDARQTVSQTLQYLKEQCISYREVIMADQVKSLMRLTEQTSELAMDGLLVPEAQSSEYLNSYAVRQRMHCVLVLNDRLKAEYACGSGSDWSDIYGSKAVSDILLYPEKIYAQRLHRDGHVYDIAAVARRDAPGLVFCVREQNPIDLTLYQASVESLLGGMGGYNTMLRDALCTYITDGETVIGSGDDSLRGVRQEDIPLIRALEESGGAGMTKLRCDGIYFGARSSYRSYQLYVFLPAGYVFAQSRNLVIVTFGVYTLAVLAAALLLVGINQDRKRREESYQRRLEEEVARATKADQAKTDFLRSMSHDIRTPLNIIMGMMEIIRQNPADTQLVQDCREKTQLASRYLLALVDDIQTINRLEQGDGAAVVTQYRLSDELHEVMTLAQAQAESQGVVLAPPVLTLEHDDFRGNPLHLRQVCQNIIGNAIKYSPPGGEVRCRFCETQEPDGVCRFTFVCEDDGAGMSEEFQKHMFEPFAQESGSHTGAAGGVGLGLAVVKRIVDACGGDIRVSSAKGKGSRFRVVLPLERAAAAAEAESVGSLPSLAGRHILVVEDNDLNREIAAYILTEAGAAVTGACDGRDAVEKFGASEPGTFAAVVMDVMMPRMSGLDAARTIRTMKRSDAAVPIIAMTAGLFSQDVEACREAGMDALVSKPLDGRRMLRTIEGCINR